MIFLIIIALPMITRHPNDNGPITVAEGSDVTLRCEATGNGILKYQWRRVSGSLPKNTRMEDEGQNLTIHDIAVKDSGQYYCEVNDTVGNMSSMRVQVTARSKSLLLQTVSCLITYLYIHMYRKTIGQ